MIYVTKLNLETKEQIVRLARVIKRVLTYPMRLALSMIYAPKYLLSEGCSEPVEISHIKVGENSYQTANIHKGRIFTDRIYNISVISKKSLVPFVSWQYLNGSILSDTENFLLNKKLLINHPPKFINGTVISLLSGGGGNYNLCPQG